VKRKKEKERKAKKKRKNVLRLSFRLNVAHYYKKNERNPSSAIHLRHLSFLLSINKMCIKVQLRQC
jgi:hypothetical protein